MAEDVGKRVRLSRLFSENGRAFCLAFDHGLQLGLIPGIEEPQRIIADAVEVGVDGMILTPGLMRRWGHLLQGKQAPVVIMRVDQTTMWRGAERLGYADGHTRLLASVEDAVAMGADAVITYLFVGHNDPALEDRNFEICAEVNTAARRFGILHVMESMAARGGLATETDTDAIAMHTRIAGEFGADIIKTDWPETASRFPAIARAAQAPILVAGGARTHSDADVLKLVAEIMANGAAGVLFGRNIFQSADPKQLMLAIRRIVHEGADLDTEVRLVA